MGFMDKAKKLADQAQAKLDETQKQFNQRSSSSSGGPVTQYDQHGRPIGPQESATPPHGDPLRDVAQNPSWGTATPASSSGAPATPGVPPTEPPSGPPAPIEGTVPPPPMPGAPPSEGDPNSPGYAPPKLTGGDPLAG
jgi:formin 2/WAS/WASL-interacting protein